MKNKKARTKRIISIKRAINYLEKAFDLSKTEWHLYMSGEKRRPSKMRRLKKLHDKVRKHMDDLKKIIKQEEQKINFEKEILCLIESIVRASEEGELAPNRLEEEAVLLLKQYNSWKKAHIKIRSDAIGRAIRRLVKAHKKKSKRSK